MFLKTLLVICYLLFVIISTKSWNLSTNNFVLTDN